MKKFKLVDTIHESDLPRKLDAVMKEIYGENELFKTELVPIPHASRILILVGYWL